MSGFKVIKPRAFEALPGLRKQRMSVWVAQKGI